MKTVLTLCKGFLRKNIRLWLPIVILLVLITSVAISMAEMPKAYTRSQIEAARNIYGEQHAVVFGIDPDVDLTVAVSYGTIMGQLSYDDPSFKQLPLIGSMDTETVNTLRIRISEGRFPLNDDEVAIERWVLSFFSNDVKVGDEVNINCKELFTENEIAKKVKIVGIVDNYSFLRVPYDSVDPVFQYGGLPSIICADKSFEEFEIRMAFSIIKLDDAEDRYDGRVRNLSAESIHDSVCSKITALYGDGYLAKSINTPLHQLEEKMISGDKADGKILEYLAGIMVTVSCLVILAFEILLLPKLRRSSIVLYKIGASGSTRFLHIFAVLVTVSEVGIITGHVLSYLLAYALSSAISGIFQIRFQFWFSPVNALEAFGIISLVALFGAAMLGWIYIELISGAPKIKLIPRGIPELPKNPARFLFLRHLSQHIGRFIVSAVAMAIALFCFSLSIAAIFNQDQTLQDNYVPDISIYRETTMSATELHLPVGDNSAVSEDALTFLHTFPGSEKYLKDIYAQKTVTANMLFEGYNGISDDAKNTSDSNNKLERLFAFAKCVPMISETDYEANLTKYGYGISDRLYTVNVAEISPMSQKTMHEKGIQAYGSVDSTALSGGTQIILCISSRANDYGYRYDYGSFVGTKIVLSRVVDLEKRTDFEFTIGAVLIIPESTDTLSYSMNSPGYCYFAVFSGCFDRIGIESDYTFVHVELTDPDKEMDILPFLNTFSNMAPNVTIKSNGQLNAELRRMRLSTILTTVLIALPIIIGSVAVIWLIHVHNLRSRRQEWRILYRLGMSTSDFQKLFILDFISEAPLACGFFMICLWLQGVTVIASGLLIFLLSATSLLFIMFIPVYFYHKRFLKREVAEDDAGIVN